MPENLEDRVTAVEQAVTHLREERIVVQRTPLNHGRMLSALRKTQVEQGQMLTEHGQVLAQHGQMLTLHSRLLTDLNGRVDTLEREMRQGFGQVRDGFERVVGMLDYLIAQDDGHTEPPA